MASKHFPKSIEKRSPRWSASWHRFLMSFDGFSNYVNEYKQTLKNKESNLYNTRNSIENISPSIEFKNIDLFF